jgi:hypothetical protein
MMISTVRDGDCSVVLLILVLLVRGFRSAGREEEGVSRRIFYIRMRSTMGYEEAGRESYAAVLEECG